ncbi:hypothetical protein PILCRDRAFT_15817 [Piloderma croceum F 1598]|uniref:Uncharacterized protein n=1 Tax=Piloderma croceum (strain F 1598) TaxID=765440 RepID=A0A0C3AG47_PILCF|nr:hypothetical protein PILCRDRAFT_15817 [Piloderma croceum F 1598]
MDAGRWFMRMKYSGRSGGLYIKHITPRLPVDLLLDSEPLTRYFNIRNEINTAQETNRRQRLQPITNHLPQDSQHVTNANMPTVPSTTITRPSAPAAPTEHTVTANGNILDTSKPANIMVWLQDGQAPIQVLGYPRLTSRLHLDDNKLLLGEHHVECGSEMEYFNPDVNRWVGIRWDSPILVDKELVHPQWGSPRPTKFSVFDNYFILL